MTTLTEPEQLLLEMVNRARLDPEAEAARLGITLNQYIASSSPGYPIDGSAKQVLAGSNLLAGVAEAHSVKMRDSGVLANGGDPHNGAGDGTPSQRIANAGYSQNSLPFIRNENVAWAGTTAALTTAEIEQQTKLVHDNLFKDDPANSFGEGGGHRLAMLDDNMREIGVGEVTGVVTLDRAYNAVIVTENFGVSGTQSFLTGVVYTDTNGDDFYGFGEARQSVTVAVTNAGGAVGSDITGSGGGWSLGLGATSGTYTVTFSGGGLAAAVSATVVAGNRNAKVDLVNGNEIFASADTTLGTNAKELHLLGIANLNGTGNALDNIMVGGRGNNILDGAGGTDTAVYKGTKASYGIVQNGDGSITISGAEGTDTLKSIEKIQFSDQLFTVPQPSVPGSVSINDISVTEGNSGTHTMTFTVTRTGGTAAFAVNYATANSTATTADNDYVAAAGTLNFAINDVSKAISVTINGDTKVEPNETFFVNLSGATNGATISDSQGLGILQNDDPAFDFTDTLPTPFLVNGKAAVLWHNDNGILHGWTLNNTPARTGGVNIGPNPGDAWHFKTSADFNGDGKADFLFQNDDSTAHVWTMDGLTRTGGVNVGPLPGAAWHIKDAADFNGDGKTDILFQNDNSTVHVWTMDGLTRTAGVNVGPLPGTAWHVIDARDLNGDGKTDILFQNDNGQLHVWTMNGLTRTAGVDVGPNPGLSWHIKAIADFTGDHKPDILWQNDNSQVHVWTMDGVTRTGGFNVGPLPGLAWHVKEAADYNGDGKTDILFQNDSGALHVWTMDGLTRTAGIDIPPNQTADWHIIA